MPVLHALRLTPNQDLLQELDAFVRTHQMEAAAILTCVGSLRRARLRFADKSDGSVIDGRFEIVSLTGTLSIHGSHVHMALSDGQGRTIGGHLLHGCQIYTTAEIVLAQLPGQCFTRRHDPATGYDELAITSNPQGDAA